MVAQSRLSSPRCYEVLPVNWWLRSQASPLTHLRPLPTEPHAIAAPVVVRHPVHILGGGSEAGDCVLAGAKGIEALIDFRWGWLSGWLAGWLA